MALYEYAAFPRPYDEAGQIFYPTSEWHHTWPVNKHKTENSTVSQEPNLNLKKPRKFNQKLNSLPKT